MHFRGVTHKSLFHWVAICFFLLYALICIATFVLIVQPNLDHSSNLRLGADSITYFEFANLVQSGNAGSTLISLSGNLLGPVLIAILLKAGWLVAIFNFFLFCIAIYAAGCIQGLNRWSFALLLMLNAETLVSIVTLNKEILSLFSAVLLATYLYSKQRSKLLLLIILAFALFARWQQLVITFMFLYLQRPDSWLRSRPKVLLAMVTFLIGAAYPFAYSLVDLTGFTQQGETGGTITTLNRLQKDFLYPIVVFPKIAMNLFGQLLVPKYFFNDYLHKDFDDLQNQYFIHLHTAAMLIVCIATFLRKRLLFKEPLILFSALYLIITSITPFIQPRYQYPVYVLLCLELTRNKSLTFKLAQLGKSRRAVISFNLISPKHTLS